MPAGEHIPPLLTHPITTIAASLRQMDLQQNEELGDTSVPQQHASGVTVVEFDMDTNVDLIRDRLNQTMDKINQNKADAMELSQENNVPEQTIIFSKSLLDYFNQNTSTHPTAKLLEPYFRQDTTGNRQLT